MGETNEPADCQSRRQRVHPAHRKGGANELEVGGDYKLEASAVVHYLLRGSVSYRFHNLPQITNQHQVLRYTSL